MYIPFPILPIKIKLVTCSFFLLILFLNYSVYTILFCISFMCTAQWLDNHILYKVIFPMLQVLTWHRTQSLQCYLLHSLWCTLHPQDYRWVDKKVLAHICSGILATNKNKILLFVTAWVDLEGIMPSEINQTEKDKYHMISLSCGYLKNKTKYEQTHIWGNRLTEKGSGAGWRR